MTLGFDKSVLYKIAVGKTSMLRNLARLRTSLQSRDPFRTIVRSADELLEAARRFNADVVSVDLFDTLVYRRVFEPNDAFYLQYDRVAPIPAS